MSELKPNKMMQPKQRLFTATLLLVWGFCAGLPTSSAQGFLNQRLDFEAENQTLGSTLLSLSKACGTAIGFSESIFEKPVQVSFSAKNERLSAILDGLLGGTGVGWRESAGQIVLFKKPPPELPVFGFVEDAETGERLTGAVVADLATGRVAVTNSYGFFSLRVPAGQTARLAAHFVGFGKKEISISPVAASKRPLILALKARAGLPEIVVSSDSVAKSSTRFFSTKKEENLARLPIARLPSLAGEPDLMRGAALLPGIGSSIDGLGGWSVRGGDADQNWVVIDDALVFNPGHGLGLFSIFDPEAVRSAQLWKGDAPARLGGSASSVFEVRTREGNVFRPSASASVGWLAGQILLETPLQKERGAVLFSARKSFLSPIFKRMSRREAEADGVSGQSDYGFYDLNFKINWSFGPKNRVYLSLFSTGDRFSDSSLAHQVFSQPDSLPFSFSVFSQSEQSWRNRFASLRWNHLFSEKCFSNTTLTASRFDLRSSAREKVALDGQTYDFPNQALSQTELRDYAAKMDVDWLAGERVTVRGGGQVSLTQVLPFFYYANGTLPQVAWVEYEGSAQTLSRGSGLNFENGLTLALHGEADWSPRQNIRLRAGFRAESFSNGGRIWFLPQPRLFFEKQWKKGFSSWVSFSSMAQSLRTVSPNSVESLGDIWLLSSEGLPPQRVEQAVFGAGVTRRDWALRVEFFAKKMRNVEEYFLDWSQQDSVLFLLPEEIVEYEDGLRQWEKEIEIGRGRAFGAELLAEKKTGRTTGWLALTVGRSERKFKKLSQNRWFPARFDRLAHLKIAAIHQLNAHFSVSAAWQYATGDAISSLLIFNDHKVRLLDLHRGGIPTERLGYGDFRQPAQHRLDVALQYRWQMGRFTQCISLGAYNVYGQKNRHYTFWVLSEMDEFGQMVQTRVNGLPFLPYLTWSGRF